MSDALPQDSRSLYINLLKRSVGNFIYDDDLDLLRAHTNFDARTGRFTPANKTPTTATSEQKLLGQIWPSRAHTMIGLPRLDNIQHCIESVLSEHVPGDLIETGVWRGGACIFMRGLLKAYGVTDRTVWVADSFAGLPPNDPNRYPKESDIPFHQFPDLAVSLQQVQSNFARYDLLDAQVRFLVGWFRDTLPKAPISRLAVLRLDGDLYESTLDSLTHLYPKLSIGGYVIVDDYNVVTSANHAVHDYLSAHSLKFKLLEIPGGGAYWRKEYYDS